MPPPDIHAATDLLDWFIEVHAWSLMQGLRLEEVAIRAGISSAHLHNLLTGTRPLRQQHVPGLARAIGLDVAGTDRLRLLARQDAPLADVAALRAARTARRLDLLDRNRALLRSHPPAAWAGRAAIWTLHPEDARRIFHVGIASLAPRTSVQREPHMTVFLRAFPVSAGGEHSSMDASRPAGSPLTPSNLGDTLASGMDPVPADLPEPDVLDFLDYRVYLRRRFEAARARHRRLSMAWLSRRLGVSGGHVINVLQGRRNLGIHTAVSAAAALGLREDRARYLPLLVEYNDAPDAHTALYAWRELSLIRARHGRELDAQADSPLFLRWTVPVVLTLSTRADWRPDPRWISATLRPQISAEDAADALRVLTAAGYLDDRPRRSPEVVRSPHWLDAHRVARLHDECLDVARDVDALGLDPCLEVELAVDGTFSLGETLDVWWEAIAAAASPCDGAKDSAPAHMFLANAFPPGPAPP